MKNNLGFYISALHVTGLNSKPARLSFEKGFNVISGLSETGKSYVFACINFMLGGNSPPKQIPESIGYSTILLEIRTYEGQIFTLSRSLQGGHFHLKEVEIEKFLTSGVAKELKQQHVNAGTDNISSFLLQLCGFTDKYVKINVNNSKREMSYRDIAGLTLIDEERIITEKSPVYSSGQYIQQTAEQSVLEILLTGKDAKDLEQVEEAKIYQGRIKGKIEFLEVMIREHSEKVSRLENLNTAEKRNQLQSQIDKLSVLLEEASVKLEKLTKEKQELFNTISELNSKSLLHDELSSRFVLLKEHYNSDIKRLEFITEGEEFFGQLNTVKCPICGGDLDKDHYDHLIELDKKTASVIGSIEKEVEKIRIKLLDLDSTLTQLAIEKEERELISSSLKRQYKLVEIEIQTNIEPVKTATKQEIDSLIGELSAIKEQELLKEQLSNYYGQKDFFNKELAKKPKIGEASDGVKYTVLQSLCDDIKAILVSWKYPNISTVNFETNYRVYDFVINNKNRNAHGKGIRAITYSAFIIGLMDYCIKNNHPHPKNIVIDSPLTTYHGKEQRSGEDVAKDMQDAFFLNLAEISNDRQIIILDNKDPNEELKAKINYIHFTNDKGYGRQGFFPL